MPEFIKLTRKNGTKILIAIDKIILIAEVKQKNKIIYTAIQTVANGQYNDIYVNESLKEIERKLEVKYD